MIPLRGAEVEVSRLAFRIQEELVKPLRELDITDSEFACLRSIVFFSPGQDDRSPFFCACSLVWVVWSSTCFRRVSNNMGMWWSPWQLAARGRLLSLTLHLPEADWTTAGPEHRLCVNSAQQPKRQKGQSPSPRLQHNLYSMTYSIIFNSQYSTFHYYCQTHWWIFLSNIQYIFLFCANNGDRIKP